MATAAPRKERLSIYLARSEIDDSAMMLRSTAQSSAITLSIGGCSEATLFIRNSGGTAPPPWTRIFTASGQVASQQFSAPRSVGALLVIKRGSDIFAITFGSGYHLLNTDNAVRDFGIRVVLNTVDAGRLRSLDKASYEHNPLNSRTQSTTEVDIFNLDMDTESEMLYAVVGVSREPTLGERIAGRDALVLVIETDLDGIGAVLDHAISSYRRPLPEQFVWFNNIRRVVQKHDCEQLDARLDEILTQDSPPLVWLGEPEIIDWESHIGYSFDLRRRTPRHAVLQLDKLRDYLQQKSLPFTTASLRDTPIHVNDHEYKSAQQWSAYRCLYAEIAIVDQTFILRDGAWFRVDRDFVSVLNHYIADIDIYDFSLPEYGEKFEKIYNIKVAENNGDIHLMDRDLVYNHARYGRIEFCDLIKDGCEFIHVKKYSGSTTLSHLFSQGQVSAELFVGDADFRERVNQKLPPELQFPDIAIRPNPSDYEIVFAIATNNTIPSELPFFSKITLRNVVKSLRALGYRVSLARIPLNDSILVQQDIPPN